MLLISGGRLCVFKPTSAACSGASRDFEVAGSDLSSRFPDQFSCWDFAGHTDLVSPMNATLVRIPLRPSNSLAENPIVEVRHKCGFCTSTGLHVDILCDFGIST